MTRTPPDGTRAYSPRSIWVFEKAQGTLGSTFYGRLVTRAKIVVVRRSGEVVSSMRYDGRFWRVYPPEQFNEMRDKWVKPGEAIYGEGSPLRLPLERPFMFDCDEPLGPY